MPDPIGSSTDYFATRAAQATQATQATQAAQTASAGKAGAGAGVDSDMFLKLLVASMKYQNPMEPMKGNEFIAQSSQLATVEALQAIQGSQAGAERWSRMATAQDMLGSMITATTDDGTEVKGVATGVTPTTDGPRLTLLTEDNKRVDVALDKVRSSTLLAAEPSAAARAVATTPAAPAGTA